jgi:hypothetical protein
MIQINCTNCKAVLQIDDAFAGGVCRCRYCGTIQTVPKRLKRAGGNGDGGALAESAEGRGAKSVYARRAGVETAGSGTGLDDLASIVASSGLTSNRLQKNAAPTAAASATTISTATFKDRKTVIIVSAAAVIIAVLLGIIIVMAVRDRTAEVAQGTDTTASNSGSPTPPVNPLPTVTPPVVVPKPSFLGQPIPEMSVAYVLDHGSASAAEGRLDLLKVALINSLKSLGPERRFQVVFWAVDPNDVQSWPTSGLAYATPQNIVLAQNFIDQVYAVGTTQKTPALKKAFDAKAEAIVLLPIKSFPEEYAGRVLEQRSKAGSNAKFYCFSLAQGHLGAELRKIASGTGGDYKDISISELHSFADQ